MEVHNHKINAIIILDSSITVDIQSVHSAMLKVLEEEKHREESYLKENDLIHFLLTSAQFKLAVIVAGHFSNNVS